MSFELAYWPQADDTLTGLEGDPELADLASEVEDTLARLAIDPGDKHLGSKTWQTETYGGVHTTPVGRTDWRVAWSVSTEEDRTLEIRYIGPMTGPVDFA